MCRVATVGHSEKLEIERDRPANKRSAHPAESDLDMSEHDIDIAVSVEIAKRLGRVSPGLHPRGAASGLQLDAGVAIESDAIR